MSRISPQQREQVRQRAGGLCEYCRKAEGYSAHSHQVDHIISQRHHGSDALENNAWACLRFNINKGTDIGGYDSQTGQLAPFYNPRTQRWDDHFELQGAEIAGKRQQVVSPLIFSSLIILTNSRPESYSLKQDYGMFDLSNPGISVVPGISVKGYDRAICQYA